MKNIYASAFVLVFLTACGHYSFVNTRWHEQPNILTSIESTHWRELVLKQK